MRQAGPDPGLTEVGAGPAEELPGPPGLLAVVQHEQPSPIGTTRATADGRRVNRPHASYTELDMKIDPEQNERPEKHGKDE